LTATFFVKHSVYADDILLIALTVSSSSLF